MRICTDLKFVLGGFFFPLIFWERSVPYEGVITDKQDSYYV